RKNNAHHAHGVDPVSVLQHDLKSNDVKKKQETLFPYLASEFQDCPLEHIGISFDRDDSNHKR
ncbi:hypothetical protein F546_12980, partial [Vibrio paracholerae 877-163]